MIGSLAIGVQKWPFLSFWFSYVINYMKEQFPCGASNLKQAYSIKTMFSFASSFCELMQIISITNFYISYSKESAIATTNILHNLKLSQYWCN
jgi:hypothetical protein